MPNFTNHTMCIVIVICLSSFIFGILWGLVWMVR